MLPHWGRLDGGVSRVRVSAKWSDKGTVDIVKMAGHLIPGQSGNLTT